MTEQQISNMVTAEFASPTLALTKQYLEIHTPLQENGRVKIERIDQEAEDGVGIAYIPVEGEEFHFAVYCNSESGVFAVGTEPYNRVYFMAYSETLTISELKSSMSLPPTKSWDKDDLKRNGKVQGISSFQIQPNSEPDTFENKLGKLLDLLEKDVEGVRKLIEKALAGIVAAITYHNGNGILGGMMLSDEMVKRMAQLNLSIGFDLYADGNEFKD